MLTMTTIDYDEAVRTAHEIETKRQWALGDLADKIEPRYGEHTLQRFAQDIGVDLRALQKYRKTARAYPPEKRLRSRNWSVAHELSSEDDRDELIEKDMSMREARQLVNERRAEEAPEPAPCRTDTCEGKAPLNPVPGLLRSIGRDWSLVRKSRRLKEEEESLNAAEELVGKMFADLAEIRRKHH